MRPNSAGEIERAVGRQFFEGGLRPARRVKDFAGDRHAEFAFDMAFRRLFGLHGDGSTETQTYAERRASSCIGVAESAVATGRLARAVAMTIR